MNNFKSNLLICIGGDPSYVYKRSGVEYLPEKVYYGLEGMNVCVYQLPDCKVFACCDGTTLNSVVSKPLDYDVSDYLKSWDGDLSQNELLEIYGLDSTGRYH